MSGLKSVFVPVPLLFTKCAVLTGLSELLFHSKNENTIIDTNNYYKTAHIFGKQIE